MPTHHALQLIQNNHRKCLVHVVICAEWPWICTHSHMFTSTWKQTWCIKDSYLPESVSTASHIIQSRDDIPNYSLTMKPWWLYHPSWANVSIFFGVAWRRILKVRSEMVYSTAGSELEAAFEDHWSTLLHCHWASCNMQFQIVLLSSEAVTIIPHIVLVFQFNYNFHLNI